MLADVLGRKVEVVEPPRCGPTPVITLREVPEGGPLLGRSLVPARVPVNLEGVADRILEPEGAAMTQVTTRPAMNRITDASIAATRLSSAAGEKAREAT